MKNLYQTPPSIGENPIITAVENLQEEVDILTNRKYVFIGDSYASGEIGSSWISNVVSVLGENNCYSAAKSGAGFTIAGNSFFGLINNLANTLTIDELSKVTDIVVGGGYNDAVYSKATPAEKLTAMSDFVNFCSENFWNAKIHLAFIGWGHVYGTREKLKSECTRWIEFAGSNAKTDYFSNIEFALHRDDYFQGNYVNPDFHPNPLGNDFLSKMIIQCLRNGSCDIHHNIAPEFSGISQNFSNAICKVNVDNGSTIFELSKAYNEDDRSPWIFGSTKNLPITISYNHAVNIATLGDEFDGTSEKWSMSSTAVCLHLSDGTTKYLEAVVGIGSGKLHLMLINNAHVENVAYIDIAPFRIVYDSMEA